MKRPAPASATFVLGLLRTRARFRTLYLGDALSMMGDWLTYVAVGLLALRGPQGIVGVALVQMAHSLPQAVSAPLAGWLSDRVDRRTLLIGASLGRGAVTLAMAAAAAAGEVLWVELLLFVRMAGASFVQAPSRAALPQLVAREELEPANRLMGSSWAVLFTAGVALGGVVTGLFGPVTALLVDAGTFALASLIFVGVGRLPPTPREPTTQEASVWRDARRFPERLGAALAKAPMFFASGAAFVILHAVLGAGAGVAFGLGGLHAARGVGNGLGPWLFRRWGDRGSVTLGLLSTAIGGGLLVLGHPVALVLGCLVWGVGVGATWVGATVWLQRVTPDGILGRYASVDLGASGVASASGGLTAALLCSFVGPWLAAAAAAAAAVILFGALRLSRLSRPVAAAGLALIVTVVAPRPAVAQPLGDTLEEALDARSIGAAGVAPRVLWSWTTRAQARALRADRRLLRSTAEDGARSPYQRALDSLAAGDGPAAELARRLTRHPDLAARRYAWTTPYGTVVPRGSRPYGAELLRIELSPDAWTIRFAPGEAPPMSVVDGEGRSVALSAAVASPSRIGAVVHVADGGSSARAGRGAFREVVIHGRVARWSLATDAIRARLRDDARVLRRLARRLRRDARGRSMEPAWAGAGETLTARYARTMPFDTWRHRPSPETFAAMRATLARRRPRGPPLEVVLRARE